MLPLDVRNLRPVLSAIVSRVSNRRVLIQHTHTHLLLQLHGGVGIRWEYLQLIKDLQPARMVTTLTSRHSAVITMHLPGTHPRIAAPQNGTDQRTEPDRQGSPKTPAAAARQRT